MTKVANDDSEYEYEQEEEAEHKKKKTGTRTKPKSKPTISNSEMDVDEAGNEVGTSTKVKAKNTKRSRTRAPAPPPNHLSSHHDIPCIRCLEGGTRCYTTATQLKDGSLDLSRRSCDACYSAKAKCSFASDLPPLLHNANTDRPWLNQAVRYLRSMYVPQAQEVREMSSIQGQLEVVESSVKPLPEHITSAVNFLDKKIVRVSTQVKSLPKQIQSAHDDLAGKIAEVSQQMSALAANFVTLQGAVDALARVRKSHGASKGRMQIDTGREDAGNEEVEGEAFGEGQAKDLVIVVDQVHQVEDPTAVPRGEEMELEPAAQESEEPESPDEPELKQPDEPEEAEQREGEVNDTETPAPASCTPEPIAHNRTATPEQPQNFEEASVAPEGEPEPEAPTVTHMSPSPPALQVDTTLAPPSMSEPLSTSPLTDQDMSDDPDNRQPLVGRPESAPVMKKVKRRNSWPRR
ncbi:hypothetical protein CPC08DRAFT_731191 [Agrocybe pediades]|nr:hypothetical protein CPC08DRAFT_731191 [Agrocybe pediades]